jgi:FkbH-like protein
MTTNFIETAPMCTTETAFGLLNSGVRANPELAWAFRHYRLSLAQTLFQAVRDTAKGTSELPPDLAQVDEWARAHFFEAIDIANVWLARSDKLWGDLFSGWIHSPLVAPLSSGQAPAGYEPGKALHRAKLLWTQLLEPQISPAALRNLTERLDVLIEVLSTSTRKSLRILFIGDCLQYEVTTALLGPCARAGIGFTPAMIHEHVPVVLRNRIRTMPSAEFDLVFFSPFTYSFLPGYAQVLEPRGVLWSSARLSKTLDELLADVALTVQSLITRFRCPIYVHNTAGTIQVFGSFAGSLKYLASRWNLKHARRTIAAGLSHLVQRADFEGRVRLVDENALRARSADWDLAKVFFRGNLFHPTRLGAELGRRTYFEAIYSAAFLSGKKVIVCDLDNTLWEGVVGEGTVTHYLERQRVLKGLRDRGVLLSINSKNDPRNVHFRGAAVQVDDFVARRINWRPKVENIASISAELNLNTKDFVFLDDRLDELARVQEAFPNIVTLNAADPSTWDLLEHWRKHSFIDRRGDRTRLYRERLARQEFLSACSQADQSLEDEAKALNRLGLSVRIELASRSSLNRAAELINRTNQFNLCGSRTTTRELEDGLGRHHWIVTATAEDRFGSMGIVAVMKVDRKPASVEIPIFVLSCRAFGFGIEYALLNSLKRLAPEVGSIVGHYRHTQHNQPCRELYSKSAFSWDGSRWLGKVADLPPDPAWLRIELETAR